MAIKLPEPGQLVEVRRRRFVVQSIQPSSLPPDPHAADALTRHHVAHLSCIEEDGLGEELSVFWELEPGARQYEADTSFVADRFDDPQRLDAFLDAIRWGIVSGTDRDLLQSPFRAGIDVEDYQLEAVSRALQMPRVNLLIADDVGLGKTIEAGLVARELMMRRGIRRILVVCPASLQIQWREQMRDKFGLEFRIIDSESQAELRRSRGLHVNPWTHFPRLITSIDYIKRDRPMRLFTETLPGPDKPKYPRCYDLLILDEAHNVAPPGAGQYAVDSLRTTTIRYIVPHFEHRLFLTATPHNGYRESFGALMELLDPQRFARLVPVEPEALKKIMVRRLKRELPPATRKSARFPERKIKYLEVDYTDEERACHGALKRFGELIRRSVATEGERLATFFVLKLLKKRLFSSPQAFAETLRVLQKGGLGAASASSAHGGQLTLTGLRRQTDGLDDDHADDRAHEDSLHEALASAKTFLPSPQGDERAQIKILDHYCDIEGGRPDTKARKLLDWLDANIRPNGKWTNERVLIFTEYRATQAWLQERLAAEGFSEGDRLMLFYGGMPTDKREEVKAAFQASPAESEVRILLATDAASEGLDFQNFCSKLIHYEIPWNPNRMEQRNGRIDRHGQPSDEVLIYHFVGKGFDEDRAIASARPGDWAGDLEFLAAAAAKINRIREDLGKVGPVIAAEVEHAMLSSKPATPPLAKAAKPDPVTVAVEQSRRNLGNRLEELSRQLNRTRTELGITPAKIRSLVDIALALAGQPVLRTVTVRRTKNTVEAFAVPQLRGTWARCTEGLEHPFTKRVRPVVFDPELARGHDDVVLAHLDHRLVQMCLRLLREQVWSPESKRALSRMTVRYVDDPDLKDAAVLAVGRLLVIGGDHHHIHDELLVAGVEIRPKGTRRIETVGRTEELLARASMEVPPESVAAHWRKEWPNLKAQVLAALEGRKNERTKNLESILAKRASDEVKEIREVLLQLRDSIASELKQELPGGQLTLFTPAERTQVEKNRGALERRITEIPEEADREERALRARYAKPDPRLLPIAVMFLVPRQDGTRKGAA